MLHQSSNNSAHETMARMFSDAAEQTHAYVEKSLHALQTEALELMNRRLDHNGTAITEYQSCRDLADLMSAQHKWFAEFNRDYYEAWLRFNQAAQRIISDSTSRAADGGEKTMREVKEDLEHREAAE